MFDSQQSSKHEIMSSVRSNESWTSSTLDFVKSSILEPIVLLHALAGAVRAIALLQIIQDKLCMQSFDQEQDYCRLLSLEEDSSLKDKILAAVSTYTTFKEILVIVPGIITAIFIGSWSDKFANGKRYCLLSTSFCQLLESCLLLLNAVYMDAPPYLVVVSFLPPSIFGNEFGFYTALFAFIASNMKNSQKALRYIFISVVGTIGECYLYLIRIELISVQTGLTVGAFLGGYIISMKPFFWSHQLQNYSGNFLVSAACSTVCFLWVLIFIREKPKLLVSSIVDEEKETDELNQTPNTSKEANDCDLERKPLLGKEASRSIWSTFKQIIDYQNVCDVWTAASKKRPGSIRLRMWLIIITINLGLLPAIGRGAVMFSLFQKLYKWDSIVISNLSTLQGIVHIIAIILVIPVLFKVIQANDCQTSMIGVMSEILADVFMGSIVSPCGFYSFALISSLSGVLGTGARSYLSKILPKEDVSKIFAVTLMLEAALKAVGTLMFASLLQLTISFYPTFSFHFMAITLIVALIILVYVDLNTKYPLS